ncbi:MAG: response regulator, partial [Rothia sp. (in: high G+C Gram-positive bacteria)]|uniref:LytR/AlgR family response regulator transcription factor n=1 Tax=Rothia sp. (in: high G+C Gram-positive bacteria) TaxID=1885016 RepID=UPI0026DF5E6E
QIIEDERFAYEELKRMMQLLRPDYELLAWTTSVEESIRQLKHERPDLLIVDIRLADGLCFDLFDQLPLRVPVIFTTAYD